MKENTEEKSKGAIHLKLKNKEALPANISTSSMKGGRTKIEALGRTRNFSSEKETTHYHPKRTKSTKTKSTQSSDRPLTSTMKLEISPKSMSFKMNLSKANSQPKPTQKMISC